LSDIFQYSKFHLVVDTTYTLRSWYVDLGSHQPRKDFLVGTPSPLSHKILLLDIAELPDVHELALATRDRVEVAVGTFCHVCNLLSPRNWSQ
jgi:hypothetical protein